MHVRNQIIIFVLLTFAVSWAFMAYIVQLGGMRQAGLLIVLVMWVPGVVCLVFRGVARLGFHDVGLKFGAGKYWALAFFVPLGIAAVAYSISWGLGIGEITGDGTQRCFHAI